MGDLLLTYWLSGVFLGVSIYAIAWVMDLDRIGKFVQAVTLLFALTPIYGMIGGAARCIYDLDGC